MREPDRPSRILTFGPFFLLLQNTFVRTKVFWGKCCDLWGGHYWHVDAARCPVPVGRLSPPAAANICTQPFPGTGRIGAGRRGSFHKHLGKYKVLILFGFF